MVNFKDDMFIEFYFAEKFEYILSVEVHFEWFDEHGDEALLEEGVDAFDAISDDFDDDGVLGAGLFGGEGFLEYEFEELNGEFVIEDDGFSFLFVAHGVVQFQ